MTLASAIMDAALAHVDTPSTAFSDTTFIRHWVNKALSKLHYALADGDNDWFAATAIIPITAGTGSYGLPDGTLYSSAPKFYKLKQLYLVSGDRTYRVDKFQRPEISGYKNTPQVTGSLTMHYVPSFVPVDTRTGASYWDAAVIDAIYPEGWEEYCALDVAVKLAIRDESFEVAQALASERDMVFNSIMARATPRDLAAPDRVRDVTDRWVGSNEALNTAAQYYYRIEGANLVLISSDITGV